MYQEERLLHILKELQTRSSMSVHDICRQFGTSRDTARRDILKLIEQGAAIRTHGGIALPALKEAIRNYRERLSFHSESKNAIGRKAASYIQDTGHYFFDVSTTVNYLAQHMEGDANVYTHALDIAEILADKDTGTVHLLGGQLHKGNRFFFDFETVHQLGKYRFDAAFLGAAAITASGIYYADKEDAILKQAAASRSKQVLLLADFQKFGREGYYRGLNWEEIDVLITDRDPPDEFLSVLQASSVELVIVNPN